MSQKRTGYKDGSNRNQQSGVNGSLSRSGSDYKSSVRSGLVSLGAAPKTTTTAKGKLAVPKPVNLPSLRKEHAGNDPNTQLVGGQGGWSAASKSDSRPAALSSGSHWGAGPNRGSDQPVSGASNHTAYTDRHLSPAEFPSLDAAAKTAAVPQTRSGPAYPRVSESALNWEDDERGGPPARPTGRYTFDEDDRRYRGREEGVGSRSSWGEERSSSGWRDPDERAPPARYPSRGWDDDDAAQPWGSRDGARAREYDSRRSRYEGGYTEYVDRGSYGGDRFSTAYRDDALDDGMLFPPILSGATGGSAAAPEPFLDPEKEAFEQELDQLASQLKQRESAGDVKLLSTALMDDEDSGRYSPPPPQVATQPARAPLQHAWSVDTSPADTPPAAHVHSSTAGQPQAPWSPEERSGPPADIDSSAAAAAEAEAAAQAERRAEEARIAAREAARLQELEEEERRKEAARRKLQELEERIAARKAAEEAERLRKQQEEAAAEASKAAEAAAAEAAKQEEAGGSAGAAVEDVTQAVTAEAATATAVKVLTLDEEETDGQTEGAEGDEAGEAVVKQLLLDDDEHWTESAAVGGPAMLQAPAGGSDLGAWGPVGVADAEPAHQELLFGSLLSEGSLGTAFRHDPPVVLPVVQPATAAPSAVSWRKVVTGAAEEPAAANAPASLPAAPTEALVAADAFEAGRGAAKGGRGGRGRGAAVAVTRSVAKPGRAAAAAPQQTRQLPPITMPVQHAAAAGEAVSSPYAFGTNLVEEVASIAKLQLSTETGSKGGPAVPSPLAPSTSAQQPTAKPSAPLSVGSDPTDVLGALPADLYLDSPSGTPSAPPDPPQPPPPAQQPAMSHHGGGYAGYHQPPPPGHLMQSGYPEMLFQGPPGLWQQPPAQGAHHAHHPHPAVDAPVEAFFHQPPQGQVPDYRAAAHSNAPLMFGQVGAFAKQSHMPPGPSGGGYNHPMQGPAPQFGQFGVSYGQPFVQTNKQPDWSMAAAAPAIEPALVQYGVPPPQPPPQPPQQPLPQHTQPAERKPTPPAHGTSAAGQAGQANGGAGQAKPGRGTRGNQGRGRGGGRGRRASTGTENEPRAALEGNDRAGGAADKGLERTSSKGGRGAGRRGGGKGSYAGRGAANPAQATRASSAAAPSS